MASVTVTASPSSSPAVYVTEKPASFTPRSVPLAVSLVITGARLLSTGLEVPVA